jgi:dTDP-L-rhamnose 4-epimerase
MIRSALERGDHPRVFEDGGQLRDFVHVSDVARANALALELGVSGAFNVASGSPHTIAEMAAAIAAAFGPGAPRPVVTGEYRLGDVRHVIGSTDRARRDLGFEAEVRFDQGMAAFAMAPLRERVRAVGAFA